MKKTIQFDYYYKDHLVGCYEADVEYLEEQTQGGSYGEGFGMEFETITEIEIVSVKQHVPGSFLHNKLFKIAVDNVDLSGFV